MNIHELKVIVNQIKSNVTCPKCELVFTDRDIELVGGVGDEVHFFHAACAKCESDTIINVTVEIDEEGAVLPNFKKLGSAPRMEQISSNEVLDMRNFLKAFNGNFEDLFKKKTKPKNL